MCAKSKKVRKTLDIPNLSNLRIGFNNWGFQKGGARSRGPDQGLDLLSDNLTIFISAIADVLTFFYESGPTKRISKWRDHGILKSIVGPRLPDKESFWILDALEWLKQ